MTDAVRCRRWLVLSLLLLILLVTFSGQVHGEDKVATTDPDEEDDEEEVVDDEDEDEDEDDDSTDGRLSYTEHQIHVSRTLVNLTGIDLSGDPALAAAHAVEAYTSNIQGRLAGLFAKTKTPECRALIAEHFGYYLKALTEEVPLPFVSTRFNNTCKDDYTKQWDFDNLPPGVHMGIIQNRTYQPPRNESVYISPTDVVLCYGVLAHDNAVATIRLIEALDEPSTQFVVHIDAKYETTHQQLKNYASKRDRVFVLDHPYRAYVNWGGYSMVNATLQVLNFADRFVPDFTHFVHIASTAYPIASNRRIRNTLADYPADANFLHIILKPARPHHSIWNYFVECDDRLHRIHRLPPITTETHGANFFTSSQWFIISKEFAQYLANPQPGDFLTQYLEYSQHTVVADENFFGTVLMNTHFCTKHHNWNFLHLQFDRWENEREVTLRDERKCVMPDPNHCGRSPTTISLDHLDILEMSGDLFARKFMDDVDTKVKDVIDTIRKKEEFELVALNVTKPVKEWEQQPKVDMSLEGYGTLIVAKETVNTSYPLCMGLGPTKNAVRLVPCFQDWVIPTLAPGWETGGVVFDEVHNHTRWQIGPCSSDGDLERLESGGVKVTPGYYTPTGPRCAFLIMDGIRRGRCLDGESLDNQPGGPTNVFPCTKRWNQYLSFGNGKEAPVGSIFTTVPMHTRNRIAETGREQTPYMCLGVARRGELDEDDWFGERTEFNDSYEDLFDDEDTDATYSETKGEGEDDKEHTTTKSGDEGQVEEARPSSDKGDIVKPEGKESRDDKVLAKPPLSDKDGFVELEGEESRKMLQEKDEADDEDVDDHYPSLLYWLGKQLMATRCDNKGAVVEWVLVPFIIEETQNSTDDAVDSTNSTAGVANDTNATSTDDEATGIDMSSEEL